MPDVLKTEAIPEDPNKQKMKKKKPDDSGKPVPLNLNDEVVRMRKEVKRVRALVIRKLTRQMAGLKKKKGKEEDLERNRRRVGRLLEEIHAMKTLKPDPVTKAALHKNLSFEFVCKNPKATISDRAIARIATHPQFSKKIDTIKAAIKAFKDERMSVEKGDQKETVRKQPLKVVEVIEQPRDSDGGGGVEGEEGDEEEEGTPADEEEEGTPADEEEEGTPADEEEDGTPADEEEEGTPAESLAVDEPAVLEKQPDDEEDSDDDHEEEESDLESSDDEKEYFDDSTEERFRKQSSQSDESDNDDFFLGKVNKFKKKSDTTTAPPGGGEGKSSELGKNPLLEPLESLNPHQTELDELEARLNSKGKSIFCSSLSGSRGGRGRGRGAGRGRGFSSTPSSQPPQQALHPSWEASKKRKEQQTVVVAFQGKKIKFDD
uniref:Serum response factor-binding protein 1 n=1 Tax=Oncorhynchus kisutch TaxID=8019 RepID=A0A8C7IEQ7_ONCKI